VVAQGVCGEDGIKYSLLADFSRVARWRKSMTCSWRTKDHWAGDCDRDKAGRLHDQEYDIPVVPDLKEVAAALQQVKTATA